MDEILAYFVDEGEAIIRPLNAQLHNVCHDISVGRRKCLREPCVPDACFSHIAVPGNVAINVVRIPARRVPRETEYPESLPVVEILCMACITVEEKKEVIVNVVPVVCRCLGQSRCSHCYFVDGRFGRHRKCIRKCSEIDGFWGPTTCRETVQLQ